MINQIIILKKKLLEKNKQEKSTKNFNYKHFKAISIFKY